MTCPTHKHAHHFYRRNQDCVGNGAVERPAASSAQDLLTKDPERKEPPRCITAATRAVVLAEEYRTVLVPGDAS